MTAIDESRFAGLYRSLGRKFVTGCKGSAARAQTVWERAFGPSWTHCRFPRRFVATYLDPQPAMSGHSLALSQPEVAGGRFQPYAVF